MKTLKNSFLFLIPLLLISSISFAQNRDRGMTMKKAAEKMQEIPAEVKADAHVSVFDEYLKLSESQKAEIKKLDLAFAEESKEIRDKKVAPRKKMPLMREAQQEHQKKIHAVLTKDQYASFLENREAIRYDVRQKLVEYSKANN